MCVSTSESVKRGRDMSIGGFLPNFIVNIWLDVFCARQRLRSGAAVWAVVGRFWVGAAVGVASGVALRRLFVRQGPRSGCGGATVGGCGWGLWLVGFVLGGGCGGGCVVRVIVSVLVRVLRECCDIVRVLVERGTTVVTLFWPCIVWNSACRLGEPLCF